VGGLVVVVLDNMKIGIPLFVFKKITMKRMKESLVENLFFPISMQVECGGEM
jgi:hypothetical protein